MRNRTEQASPITSWRIVSLVALVLSLSNLARTNDNAPVAADESLVGRFAIGKAGRPIVVPVSIGDRTILSLVDTGACCTGFDLSLMDLLGQPRGHRTMHTAAGPTRVEMFDPPDAMLGGRPLNVGSPVMGLDLGGFRRATNLDLRGVIGMDVLAKCRLLIDFDRGLIHFLDELPVDREKLGTRLPLRFRKDGTPTVSGSIANYGAEQFVIDTGAESSSLDDVAFDELLDQDKIKLASAFGSATIAGNVRGDRGRLKNLTIGPFAQKETVVTRVNECSLGLRFLARFRVTLDFPGSAVYLRKGSNYESPEPAATSGLMLNWVDGEIRVVAVREDSPASSAGVKPQDVLMRVNHQDASEYDPFALRQLLTSAGGTEIPMTIRRGKRQMKVQLVLLPD